ncbi:probable bifunctional dTTP/UTP pyrophosphatase/methyltransferase protein isoform X2 [Takifugu flavidus]|uniref:probable bifunctional dTTP/UTP pyrophosphatase/methyltransferase protein isoform X2 n=1 Tax=Takifugu flavidus TaxID=433684 RepID=UPI0025449EB0|nr:probable bifunctional dTTP/UTP pyrophosphatase/methyltransferase protein isoform X2 [Takifugu flavidus]
MVLNPVISKLAGKLVVLASASPRRMEILRNTGLRFEVVPSWFKETLDKEKFKAPYEYAVETAKHKALEVAKRMPLNHLKTPDVVIGADTIVAVDGTILEKPVDKNDAYRMLSRLSGKEHSVYTGVVIVLCHENEIPQMLFALPDKSVDYRLIDFYEETKVKFADLSESMLWEYIDSGEPMDKAGGYGIQALGGMLVERVHGDFLNVVGFPLNHFCKQLDVVFNTSGLLLSQEILAHSETNVSSLASSRIQQPNPAAMTSPDTSAKSDLSKASCFHQTHGSQTSPSASPVHKVKKNGDNSKEDEHTWPLGNSCSTNPAAENTTAPSLSSREQLTEVIGTQREDNGPQKDDLQRIIELMDGFKASKALFTASRLGVFDLLQSRPELDAAQVAQEIKASVKGTQCLLDACVSLGLLRSRESSCQKRVYMNAALAQGFLLSDAPHSLGGYIQHCDQTVWPLFTHLECAVRDGTHQHEKAFGKKANDLFQDTLYNNQDIKLRFMSAMHSIAKVTGRAVATAFDLSRFKTACDLGGCTGALAHELTKAHPEMRVTVFDLPTVVEMSGRFSPQHSEDRVSFLAGDFFEDELPKADLYILARILHDWPDEKVHVLLRRIADSCTSGSAVLIAETMLDGGKPHSALQSLNMLVQTEGMERRERQFADLLCQHGFGDVQVVHTRNFLDALIAFKM